MPKSRGNVRHGLYRNLLDEEEQRIADALAQEYRRAYGLDTVADEDALRLALSFLVKACRKTPPQGDDDHNVRDYQAYYARQYGEFLDRLGISRKMRKDDGAKNDMLAAISRLLGLGKPEHPDAIDVHPANRLPEHDEAEP